MILKINGNQFEKLIINNLSFIENQSNKIVRKGIGGLLPKDEHYKLELENRALELTNSVLDTLRRDDYKILKVFGGRAKITTYLATIISRQFVDIVRKKFGRSREKERAKAFDELGLKLYDDVIVSGLSLEKFHRINIENKNRKISIDELLEVLDFIKGKKRYDKKDIDNYPLTPVKKGKENDYGEIIVIDNENLPEKKLINDEQKRIKKKTVDIALKNLTEEEKFILRVKFFDSNEEKVKITKIIANALNINKRKVYTIIEKTLKKCKKILEKEGINADDLF